MEKDCLVTTESFGGGWCFLPAGKKKRDEGPILKTCSGEERKEVASECRTKGAEMINRLGKSGGGKALKKKG